MKHAHAVQQLIEQGRNQLTQRQAAEAFFAFLGFLAVDINAPKADPTEFSVKPKGFKAGLVWNIETAMQWAESNVGEPLEPLTVPASLETLFSKVCLCKSMADEMSLPLANRLLARVLSDVSDHLKAKEKRDRRNARIKAAKKWSRHNGR